MPIETIKDVEIKHLLFDPGNPRLPELVGKKQNEIFRFLVDEIGVEDVLQSIAASGVIEGDPIIARKAETNGQFYVIEGNRRLAALKLLNGEKIADGKDEPSLPAILPAAGLTIKKINIQIGWTEQNLDAYLGYKHVTATREWPPEAKARFVISKVKGNFSSENLTSFAKRLGTTLPTLRRWLVAFLTLKQAQEAGKFDPKEAYAKRYFGAFYTLLGSQEVKAFLGLISDPLTTHPVPNDHIPQLAEFIGWSIGTRKDPPVVNSRKQQKLDAVLSSKSALQHFRLRHDLDAALLYTEYNAPEISSKLLNAAYGIEECLPKLFDVRADAAVVAAIETLDAAYRKLQINAAELKTLKAR
jgi:hypothetical protein